MSDKHKLPIETADRQKILTFAVTWACRERQTRQTPVTVSTFRKWIREYARNHEITRVTTAEIDAICRTPLEELYR